MWLMLQCAVREDLTKKVKLLIHRFVYILTLIIYLMTERKRSQQLKLAFPVGWKGSALEIRSSINEVKPSKEVC